MANIFGAVAFFLAKRFSGVMRETEAAVSVGLAVVVVAERDPERMSLTLVNVGASPIFIAPFKGVNTLRGIRLGPAGGVISFNVEEDAHLPSLEWNGISDAAGGLLYRLEARRDVAVSVEGGTG